MTEQVTGSQVNSTFVGNRTGDGGGTLCDTASTVSSGWKWASDASCGFTGTGDVQRGTDPGLGALTDNGGPTSTRSPLPDSPLMTPFRPATAGSTSTSESG